jgi:hypothetical protein
MHQKSYFTVAPVDLIVAVPFRGTAIGSSSEITTGLVEFRPLGI